MSMRFFLVLICGFILNFNTSFAVAQIYVVEQSNPLASDQNPGTSSLPWKSVAKAAATATAGSTIIVKTGTYFEVPITSRSGTSADPIRFKAEGKVTLNGFTISHPYVELDGFTLTNMPTKFAYHLTVTNGGTHCIIRNVTVENSATTLVNGMNISSNNCLISGSRIRNLMGHAVVLSGSGHIFENNSISEMHGYDAFRVFGSGHRIRQNYIHSSPVTEGVTNHPDVLQNWGTNGQVSYDILFERNMVINFEAQIGILEQDGSANVRDWTIAHNVFVNTTHPLHILIPGVKFLHNTLYANATDSGVVISLAEGYRDDGTVLETADGAVIRDNVFVGNVPAGKLERGWYTVGNGVAPEELDYNFVAGTQSEAFRARVGFNEAHGVNGGDPMFVDIHNPLGPDSIPFTSDDGLIPLANSPLCRAASTLNADLGAYSCKGCDGSGPIPYISAQPLVGYAPLEVNFDASKSLPCGSALKTYIWDFGDGTNESSTQGSISHTYQRAGDFVATLTVEDTLGRRASKQLRVLVNYSLVPNLILYQSFDNDSVRDLSGRDHVAEWVGTPSYGTGSSRGAISLAGGATSAYVKIGNQSDLQALNQATIAGWAKKSSAGTGGFLLLKHGTFRLSLGGSDVSAYFVNSNSQRIDLTSKIDSNTNWNYLAATFDGAKVALYINGVMVGSQPFTGPLSSMTYDLLIGKDPFGSVFSGMIDEIRIYDRALQEAEILRLYNNPSGVDTNIIPNSPTRLRLSP